ncbi:MAG: peptidase C25, partial [Thermoplasmata archaeon]|nr:peptidase C25 [Thermoplasmata archaeon]
GRLACRNEYEVKLMVNKIIEYETGDAANKPWFKRMVLVGGDSWPDKDDPYYEGEEENKVAMDVMHGFNYTTLWTSDGTLTGAEDVINAVSKGCGFLFFDGHGNPMSWATHPPHDENTWITGLLVSDMSKLSNNGMYPVCIVGACHNSQFNVSVLNLLKPGEFYKTYYRSEWSPECWSWWIVRKANGGAIASLGYAGLDYFAIGDSDKDGIPDCTQYFSGFMNTHFFMNYANGTNIIGNIQGNVLNEYIDYSNPWKDKTSCKTIEEWVLLGDPSLKIGGYSS